MNQPDMELEERLRALEPPYKSRGETQVGRLLDRYGIPFFYEQPVVVLDRGRHHTWHPDFTLPSYHGLIVEYAGMPDIPEYMQGIQHKQQVYKVNGIPAMFVYPQDLTGPAWSEEIYHRIQREGEGALRAYNRSLEDDPVQRYH